MKEIKRENDSAQAVQQDRIVFKFTCPKCRGNGLVEMITGQRSELTIVGFTLDGEVIRGYEEVDGGDEHWFECGDCSYVLKDDGGCPLSDTDELLQWIKDHGA